MEDLVERLTRGNVTEVKVVLATVVAALAIYQVMLAAVIYGRLRVPFLAPSISAVTHRTIGDAVVVVALVVAFMCVAVYGFDTEESVFHVIVGSLLVVFLALKVAAVKWWHGAGFVLPALGITVFGLFALTWASSAGEFLGVT